MPHPADSPSISPCDFWSFATLKEILKDPVFNSNNEIGQAIASVWNDLTFGDVLRVFHSSMRDLASVIKNGGEYPHE
jgi:hypothetical protein